MVRLASENLDKEKPTTKDDRSAFYTYASPKVKDSAW